MAYSPTANLPLILGLLREHSTLEQVRRFLQEREVPRSATSWSELEIDRILPALESGKLTEQDLLNLTREREEYGRQHIFLYRTERFSQLRSLSRVRRVLKGRGIEAVLDAPLLINKPNQPTIAEVRSESGGALTVKVVKTRFLERHERQETQGDSYTIKIERIPTRAVHVLRLNEDGLLEMRVASHATLTGFALGRLRTSRYEDDVKELWEVAGEILPRDVFDEESLARAKANLWRNRDKLPDEVRYSGVKVRDEYGFTMNLSAGDFDSTLSGNANAAKAIDTFYDKQATSERMKLVFLDHDGTEIPSGDIYVLAGGSANEFAIPSLCSKDDYEYVLRRLLHHNR